MVIWLKHFPDDKKMILCSEVKRVQVEGVEGFVQAVIYIPNFDKIYIIFVQFFCHILTVTFSTVFANELFLHVEPLPAQCNIHLPL